MTEDSILEYLKTCETKIFKLENGEPFTIIVRCDDIDSGVLYELAQGFKQVFPDTGRRIPIIGIGMDQDIDFITLREAMEKTNGIS